MVGGVYMGVRKILIASLLTSLSGCASDPFVAMSNNNFVGTPPLNAPSVLHGFWTGSVNFFTVTYKINPDGTGFHCMSPSGANESVSKVKYIGDARLSQSGTRMVIESVNGAEAKLKYPYRGGGVYVFYKDDSLSNAALECNDLELYN